jgi:siderophore synthetase component
MADDNAYISQRIINACLREDVCQLVSQGQVVAATQLQTNNHWPESSPAFWLKVSHLGPHILYIPIVQSHYMQKWQATSAFWLKETSQGFIYNGGFKCWLDTLAEDLSAQARLLFSDYIKEAQCAVEHRKLCRKAYQNRITALNKPLSAMPDWHQKLLFSDQIAAYLDHPYYPTARAKFGFDAHALMAYAPEFAASFELNWVAIANDKATLTSIQPDCWPTFVDVGLAAQLKTSYRLFPVHPLTFKTLRNIEGSVLLAPKSALRVLPTLSVRTVVVEKMPDMHIKVPLIMATLGAKNMRLIKASTLYDGHWFEKVLTQLAQQDIKLQGLYLHCNEQHGGHLGEFKQLAYIVRQYSSGMFNKTLVPVAALGSEMPDQRLYLSHLIDNFYQGNVQAWLDDYLTLLLSVHLRLWLKYGIALESNQQNAVLAFSSEKKLMLVMKDNDSARLFAPRFVENSANIKVAQEQIEELIDPRIIVDNEQSIAQMFTTITLQLDIAAIFEAMASYRLMPLEGLYGQLRNTLLKQLDALDKEGISTQYARDFLLESAYLPAKYLLSSGSLLSKSVSGASDINKFYGQSAPNFLHQDFLIKRVSCP